MCGVASHRIVCSSLSELVLGSFLLLALDLNLRLLLIELHELGQIELGLLEQLDLSHEDVLEREDLLAFLSNGLADLVADELLGKLLEGGLLSLANHNLHHLLADELALRALGVAGGANLSAGSLGETDAEHTEEVAVSGLGLHEGLDGCVPLLDNGAELIAGDVHTVEVGIAVEALNFFDLDLHLSPGLFVAVSVQISQRYLKHTTLEGVSSNLLTSSSVAGSKSGGSHVENGGNVNIVPFLLGE